MKRRQFLKTSSAGVVGTAALASPLGRVVAASIPQREKVLAAYYFLAGMYTLVPRNIRNELDEMASWGTDVVCIAVTSLAMDRAQKNVEFIVDEAHQRGMKVHVVPSRLAGITAGAPVVPSSFAQLNPDTWILDRQGNTPSRKVGPICSFYHPKVEEFFHATVRQMMALWDIDGFVWDEPKATHWQDFSPLALQHNPEGDFRKYMQDLTAFFSRINRTIKQTRPEATTVYFDEAIRPDLVVEESAKMQHLDYFGADGRPWPEEVSPMEPPRGKKSLYGYGQRFLTHARANGQGTMYLLESHANTRHMNDLMEQYLPGVLEMDVDYLAYYYYGRNQEEPERNMDIIRRHISQFKK